MHLFLNNMQLDFDSCEESKLSWRHLFLFNVRNVLFWLVRSGTCNRLSSIFVRFAQRSDLLNLKPWFRCELVCSAPLWIGCEINSPSADSVKNSTVKLPRVVIGKKKLGNNRSHVLFGSGKYFTGSTSHLWSYC